MKAKREVIEPLPGRWIDFSDRDNICIREADGTLVATDLQISKQDFKKLRQKFLDTLAHPDVARHPPHSREWADAFRAALQRDVKQ